MTSRFTACLLATLLVSCSTSSKPCSKGGDVSWANPIRGDKHCTQKRLKDGSYVNEGVYTVSYPNGKRALQGEFVDGKKQGYWYQYNEKGEKILEKYFEDGVEKSTPGPSSEPRNSRAKPVRSNR